MKDIFKILFIVCISTFYSSSYGQSCFKNNYSGFSNTTNYLDVDTTNFIVTNGGSQLENYHLSSLKLAIEIGKIADTLGNEISCSSAGFHQNTPINIINKFTAYRVEYTPELSVVTGLDKIKFKLRALVIKPNNASNAPCVLVTHGNDGVLRDWRGNLLYGVSDLLMKGYVVVIFENLSTQRRVPRSDIWGCISKTYKYVSAPGTPICMSTMLFHIAYINCGGQQSGSRWKLYNFLTIDALAKYIAQNSSTYNVNPNKLFTYGFSFGSGVAEGFLTKKSEFPSALLYNTSVNHTPIRQAGFNSTVGVNFTIPSADTSKYTILGGIPMSSPLMNADNNCGKVDVYTSDDSTKRLLLIHGFADSVTAGSYYFYIYPRKQEILDSVNIKNYLITACGEGHSIFKGFDNFISATGNIFNSKDRNYPFYTFVSNLTTSTINTMKDSLNLNTTYKNFMDTIRGIDNQIFQLYKSGSQFYVNAINNTSYVLCSTENSYDRKTYIGNEGVYGSTYNANDWLYKIYNASCELPSGERKAKEINNINEMGFKSPMLFPNPTTGIFNIEIPVKENIFKYSVVIYNSNGQVVSSQTINKTYQAGEIIKEQFDISNQSNGIYFLSIYSGDKIIYNESVILNK